MATWLPRGKAAYCTYNEMPPQIDSTGDHVFKHECEHDVNHARYSPPFPVSRETYVSWNTQYAPPLPFHAVSIARSLSAAEMEEKLSSYPQPLRVLTNINKIFIYSALAEMRIPARFVLSIVP